MLRCFRSNRRRLYAPQMTTTTTSAINNEENNIKNKIPTSSLSRLVIVNFYFEKWNVFIVPKTFNYYRDWKWFLRREAFLPPFPLTLLVPSNSTPNFSEELSSPPLLCEHSLGLHLTLCLFPSLSLGKRLWRDISAAQQPTAQHRHPTQESEIFTTVFCCEKYLFRGRFDFFPQHSARKGTQLILHNLSARCGYTPDED